MTRARTLRAWAAFVLQVDALLGNWRTYRVLRQGHWDRVDMGDDCTPWLRSPRAQGCLRVRAFWTRWVTHCEDHGSPRA